MGYWVPLVFTVTVATIGLAAWVWKERNDNDDEDDRDRKHDRPPGYRDVGPGQTAYVRESEQHPSSQESSVMARMSGALRRTPSPQQFLDETRRVVTGGVAAVGAAVGGALSSIREEDKRDYEDHSRWSEEAEARAGRPPRDSQPIVRGSGSIAAATAAASAPLVSARPGDKRKTVAIVLSADVRQNGADMEETRYQEHAVRIHSSIL